MGHEPGYPTPRVTADVVAVCGPREDRRLLLVERGNEPFKGRWALPGGFVDEYEEPGDAAARELAEETAIRLDAPPSRIVGVYGGLGRDPRGWTVTVAYLADLGAGDAPEPAGGDDAAQARWWPVAALPPLAFDHDRIVSDALALLDD